MNMPHLPGFSSPNTTSVQASASSGQAANDLASEFQQAMLHRQLSLNYQPIVNLETGLVCGFETLMRWNHPSRGFISPGVFIPLAEQTGMIVEASKWALKEAINALKRLESHVGHNENIYMSVNFSPNDLAEESFLDEMYRVISASDIRPTQVQLEITAELLRVQPENARTTLGICRKTGLKIAIDDFGIGDIERSFGYMDIFPISAVKIDHLVTRDMLSKPEVMIIVEDIIGEAKRRGIEVIAEGVETREEALKLIALGCRYAQGYYFAKPLPERELTSLLLQMNGFSEQLK